MINATSEIDYKDVFHWSSGSRLIIAADGPNYTILDVNAAFLQDVRTTRTELFGKPFFSAFLFNVTEETQKSMGKLKASFDEAFRTKQPNTLANYRYDMPNDYGPGFAECYWTSVNTPVLNAEGDVQFLIHLQTDVTQVHALELREQANVEALRLHREQLHALSMQAPLAILEAEERARLAVDAVGLGTYDLNLQTGELFTSDTFFRIFGCEHPLSWTEYQEKIHPEDRAIRNRAHEHAMRSGRLVYDARILFGDGTIRTARFEGKVNYENNHAVRLLGTVLDITDQKQLKAEQQKLITLVANSVDAMAILNLDGTASYLNQAAKALLGIQTELPLAAVQMSPQHPTDGLFRLQDELFPKVLLHKEWSGSMNIRHLQTGELIPVFSNMTCIDDPDNGALLAVGTIIRDLRSESSVKQALEKSESLLREITSAAPTGLWQADEHGSITYINGTWVKWTAVPEEQQLGFGWLKVIIPEDRETTRKAFSDSLLHRRPLEAEFRINHADGTVHWCIADGHPQYNAYGAFVGYIGALADITDQKLLQQQKDDFIGIASHELKTPVTSLKAYTQVLERMLLKKGDIREAAMISKMDTQLNRLTDLIGDLLDVTKINSGKIEFNNHEFDFNELVHELLEDLQRTTEKHLLIENLEPLKLLYGDRERLGQVIVNLITNAIKYSPNSDKIYIRSSSTETELTFCVQDFGIGIDPVNREKVFEQFYRVNGDLQHTFPGLGLGLYISSEIIKREGGRIWLSSQEMNGSTFCFAIPLKNPNVND
jgi:PAS domain S-box-containing protein